MAEGRGKTEEEEEEDKIDCDKRQTLIWKRRRRDEGRGQRGERERERRKRPIPDSLCSPFTSVAWHFFGQKHKNTREWMRAEGMERWMWMDKGGGRGRGTWDIHTRKSGGGGKSMGERDKKVKFHDIVRENGTAYGQTENPISSAAGSLIGIWDIFGQIIAIGLTGHVLAIAF